MSQQTLFENEGLQEESTYSREASRVNLTALLESVKRLMMSVISGRNLPGLFANLIPDSSLSKMYWASLQVNLDGSSDEYLETWPKWGIMRDGACYAHPTPERHTGGKELLLWATPAAADCQGSHGGGQGRSLRTDIYNIKHGMWPTPRSREAGDYQYSQGDHSKPVPTLSGAVKMWPTPNATDYKGPCSLKRRPECDDDLPTRIMRQNQSQLNPAWVEALQGFPPGWTDLDGPPDQGNRSMNGSRPESQQG